MNGAHLIKEADAHNNRLTENRTGSQVAFNTHVSFVFVSPETFIVVCGADRGYLKI